MYVLIGGFITAITLVLYASPRMRGLEEEIPDAVPARPAPAPEPQPAAAGA